MNKKIFSLLFLFICCFYSASADMLASIEIRGAGFFHTSKVFRDIYGKTGGAYEVQLASRFQNCSEIEIWTNYSQFSKQGKISGNCCGKSRVQIYDISLGLNYVFPLCNCLETYAGIGGSLSKINLKNRGCCTHEKESKLAGGLVLKSGIVYYVTCHWFLDFFVDYLYQPVHFHHRHVDIGGVKVGGGVGWCF